MRPDDSTPARADPQHRVQIYDDDAFLVESVVRFAGAALGAGDAVVLIATEHLLAAVEEGLEAQALSVATARAQGRYVALEAARTLAELLQDGRPDAARQTNLSQLFSYKLPGSIDICTQIELHKHQRDSSRRVRPDAEDACSSVH